MDSSCNCEYPGYTPDCDICETECMCSSCSLREDPMKECIAGCPQNIPCEDCWHIEGGHSHPVLECAAWNSQEGFRRK